MQNEPTQPRVCSISLLADDAEALDGLFGPSAQEGAIVTGPEGVTAELNTSMRAPGFDAGTFLYDVVVSFTAAVPAGVLATWICGKLAEAKGLKAAEIGGEGVDLRNPDEVARALEREADGGDTE